MKYYKINLQFSIKKDIPFFIGSQIRGAMGYALKKVVCINPSFKCQECFAQDNCLYYDFYEKKGVYHKYRLDFTLGNSTYDFNFYLFEDSTKALPYVISAFYKLFTEIGLGVDRETTNDFTIKVDDKNIYKDGNFSLDGIEPQEWSEDVEYREKASLKLITPLRIKSNNRFVRSAKELDIKGLINSIYQRQRMLQGLERAKLPFEPTLNIADAFVNFKDLSRYSNRQRGKLKIGGLLGYIELKNIDIESFKLLKLAELIGVGKQTTFGLGKVQLLD